ncbi:ATP-binding protein [Pseudanabaena sp. FACHB-1998]|uniref:AAA family ATPase n=1 Tax=Pseudanabaena sp. FACHB-1998 TaxID=2692858 RepID=UPI001680D65D|nr:ATP-binding protein [Pseudanabaena sp. FACHB-1998]MBD2176545.1 ATP-binding protein [Pseudanabaena sp. FACHB-1998]
MLLDFTVENFRSIKGAETLSAVAASKSKAKPNNTENRRRVKSDDEIAQPFHIESWDIDVLPVIAIFGANASGKSNVLKALEFLLKYMILGNYARGVERIPFKLNFQTINSPSYFKLRTAFNGTIYTYSLVLNSVRILVEKLEYTLVSTKRERLLFSRTWNGEQQEFDWKNGSDFSGSHTQLEKSIQDYEPFISLVLTKLDIKVVTPLSEWLRLGQLGTNFRNETLLDGLDNYVSKPYIPQASEVFVKTKQLLLKFDTGLFDIETKKSEEGKDYQVYALHKAENGEIVRWKFEEESLGTRDLLSLAFKIQSRMQSSSLLIADEFGSNLHPNITSEIVQFFQNPKTNPNRTQLIFTSHDNTLQRNNLLRRDQIWFTQKRPDQSTELYSLSDFKVRNDLAIDKAYLDGRFGAVPFISDEDDFMPVGNGNG